MKHLESGERNAHLAFTASLRNRYIITWMLRDITVVPHCSITTNTAKGNIHYWGKTTALTSWIKLLEINTSRFKCSEAHQSFDGTKKSRAKQIFDQSFYKWVSAGGREGMRCDVLRYAWSMRACPDEKKRMMHYRSWDASQPNTRGRSNQRRCGDRFQNVLLWSRTNGVLQCKPVA